MIAVDTNVVLRLILGDDKRQVAAIRALMARATLFVSLSVLLETGWVLDSRYRMARNAVADALNDVVALDGIEVSRRKQARWAIERYRLGADWADMVHVVAATKVAAFATLDRRLPRQAGDTPPVPIERLD